jgi:6-phosphogluconolactonase
MTLVAIGTYTSPGRSQGIYVYRLDAVSGGLLPLSIVSGISNPTYLAHSPRHQTLYAVNELVDNGGVSAFALDQATGELTLLNQVASGGADPAHISVHPTDDWLLVANYTGGTIAVLPIRPDGSLGEASDVVHHTGSGPNAARQREPHPHMILTDPQGEFVLVSDLGIDAVVAYRLDRAAGRLIPQPEAGGRLPPGAGPRHLAFGAGGRSVYVIYELGMTLAVFAYDGASGRLRQTQLVRTLPASVPDSSEFSTAAVVVAPSGRFVYGSNRGHDSLAGFKIDEASGELSPIGHTPTGGRTPRDFNIDPTGTFLLAANQDTDTVVTFRIDASTGALAPTGQSAEVPNPGRVLFVPALP